MLVIKGLALLSLLLNLMGFVAMGFDKFKAVKHKYRIPERFFLNLSFFTGGIGVILGMFIWRHKLRKPLFYLWIPLVTCVVWVLIGYAAIQLKLV